MLPCLKPRRRCSLTSIDQITDEGASALGAVLAGRMGLRSVDLRGNRISKQVCTYVRKTFYLCLTVGRMRTVPGGERDGLPTPEEQRGLLT